MMVDLEKIKELLKNENLKEVSRQTGIPYRTLQNWKLGNNTWLRDVENRLYKLNNYIKLEENKMYKLIAREQGELQSVENFDTFEELKNHLIENDYFSWIHDEEPEKELPNFEEVEDVWDIQATFEEFDYSWWTMELEVNEDL